MVLVPSIYCIIRSLLLRQLFEPQSFRIAVKKSQSGRPGKQVLFFIKGILNIVGGGSVPTYIEKRR